MSLSDRAISNRRLIGSSSAVKEKPPIPVVPDAGGAPEASEPSEPLAPLDDINPAAPIPAPVVPSAPPKVQRTPPKDEASSALRAASNGRSRDLTFRIYDRLIREIDSARLTTNLTPEAARRAVEDVVEELLRKEGVSLSRPEEIALMREVADEIFR